MDNIIEGEVMTPTPKATNKEEKPQARTMNFPDAMREIIKGNSVARVSWGNNDYCLLKDGWLSINRAGTFHTWTVNDGDMEGEDWVVEGGIN